MKYSRFDCWLLFLLLAPCAQLPGADSVTISYPPAAEVKSAFLKLLDRPRVPLDAQTSLPPRTDDRLITEQLSIATEQLHGRTERVPLLIVRPADTSKKLPAIIVLHGTGGNKEGMHQLLVELARRRFLAVAIDARYHGERAGGATGATAYNQAIIRAWRDNSAGPHEHPFYFDTCWDLWRTIDYLVSRDEVDSQRIGMIGFSMGGIETWLAAAVDDRVRVAVPAIGVQSFRWSLEHEAWQARAKTINAAHETARADLNESMVNARVCRELWSKVVPGILDQFDCPSMIRLFAGRPLLILNGELDRNCPLAGAELAFAAAAEAFQTAGAPDKLQVDVAKGVGHAVTAEQRRLAVEWFEKWLEP